jgi:hypothetical protein
MALAEALVVGAWAMRHDRQDGHDHVAEVQGFKVEGFKVE